MRSCQLIQDRVRKAGHGEWILGSGWHQEKWRRDSSPKLTVIPTHTEINKVSSDNPALLYMRADMPYLRTQRPWSWQG